MDWFSQDYRCLSIVIWLFVNAYSLRQANRIQIGPDPEYTLHRFRNNRPADFQSTDVDGLTKQSLASREAEP